MFKAALLPPSKGLKGQVFLHAEIKAGDYIGWWDDQDKTKEFDIEIKRHRERRSKDANAYFHVLCNKIAVRIGSSAVEVKNLMIERYGRPVMFAGKPEFVIVRDDKDVRKFAELHLQPTSQTKELNGVLYRVYINMRGSHEYNTAEMARLIEGTISEAREIGIPEAEIIPRKDAEMLQLYGVKM